MGFLTILYLILSRDALLKPETEFFPTAGWQKRRLWECRNSCRSSCGCWEQDEPTDAHWTVMKQQDEMLCGLSKTSITSAIFYQLNCKGTGNSTTNTCLNLISAFNFALFGVCTISVILTCWKFNSITVLNIRVRPTAISNVLWIFYFSILGIRSLFLGIVYIDNGNILKKDTIAKILFPIENVFKILELLFLSWALEYQRKHRSGGFIQDEIEQFNDRTEESGDKCHFFKKVPKTTYNIFTAQAFVCLVFISVFTFFLLESKKDKLQYLYWTLNGCVWSLCISYIVLMFIIVLHRTIDEGPSSLTKVFLFCGVVLTLPADIPPVIWKQCILKGLSLSPTIGYITSPALMIIAVVVFMAVLIREFQRLKEEAQWNVIDQVESYYSITESM